MSIKAMDEVFTRLVCDKAFRELLRRNPEKTLAGYDLTPEERAGFAKLKKQQRWVRMYNPDALFGRN